MAGFEVTRLLANPLGQVAAVGQRGDIVRVSNGRATIYLDPAEFDAATEGRLEYLLAEADTRPRSTVGASTPAGGRSRTVHQIGAEARHC